MRAIVLAVAMAVASTAAIAGDTIRFGGQVVSVGDAVGKVIQSAGNPDRTVPLQNKYGASIGERFEYYRDGKTIQITVQGGRVTKIDEIR